MEKIISPSLNFEDTAVAFEGKSNSELLQSYRLFQLLNNDFLVRVGIRFTPLALKLHIPISPLIRATIYAQFCGGETLKDCEEQIAAMAAKRVFSILDYGVEAQSGEQQFDAALKHKLETIAYAAQQKSVKVLSGKISGLGEFSLLEKYAAGKRFTDDEQKSWLNIQQRLTLIGQACMHAGIQLYWDAEETWIQPALDFLIEQQMKNCNAKKPIIFNTYQLYCKNRLEVLMQHHEAAKSNGFILGAKLVRGAYMEKERARATKHHYPSPIHENKDAVNRDFNAAIVYCIRHIDTIAFCCASHNEESNSIAAQLITTHLANKSHPHAAFAQLYGMGDHLTFNLAANGFFSLKLIPYGPVKKVIPYLLRRAEENSALGGQVSRELILLKNEIQRRKR